MYLPDAFAETDSASLQSFIQAYPFGLLATASDSVPEVTHLPFEYQAEAGSKGKIIGHIARANPQVEHLRHGNEAQVIFQGPHAYISPAWYEDPGVPTWNYTAVYAKGTPRLIEDEEALKALLIRLTQQYENQRDTPWQLDVSDGKWDRLLQMIVGFEIEVCDLQGKFKLSQNRSQQDQRNVIDYLSQSNDAMEQAVAAMMTERQE